MLAISPLSTTTTTTNTRDGCGRHQLDMDSLPSFSVGADVDFPDFDSIDFDDLFGGDALPYLEIDTEFLADFSVCTSTSTGEEESSAVSVDYAANQIVPSCYNGGNNSSDEESKKDECQQRSKDEEIQSKKSSSSHLKTKKSSKSNNTNNNNDGKRKTKVDWTPDLHRRFVQAVEQLGVDKAVPSRILELMGIDCLTRHNVASHLQKYRSHRKHLLAREAEAATWTQKRQMYSMAVVPPPPNVVNAKANTNHQWPVPPTMGFPPPTPPPIHHPFRPLHVWGHPTHRVEHQPPMPIWHKPLPPHAWPAPLPAHPPPPPADPSLWHTHHQRIPNAMAPLTPCFPHQLPTTRYGVAPPVPGIPPTHAAMYRPNHHHGVGPPAVTVPSGPGPAHTDPLDLHPTKESIDAAIGEVLSKPWLPLPIGLKPPATDSVMGELERQGIPAVPPSCA
ncbi:hypothetical protein V2J09_019213 [Rumex salicifolius]